jgi:hypothetical protein
MWHSNFHFHSIFLKKSSGNNISDDVDLLMMLRMMMMIPTAIDDGKTQHEATRAVDTETPERLRETDI